MSCSVRLSKAALCAISTYPSDVRTPSLRLSALLYPFLCPPIHTPTRSRYSPSAFLFLSVPSLPRSPAPPFSHTPHSPPSFPPVSRYSIIPFRSVPHVLSAPFHTPPGHLIRPSKSRSCRFLFRFLSCPERYPIPLFPPVRLSVPSPSS